MEKKANLFIQHQTDTYYDLFNPPPRPNIDEFIENISNSQITVVGPEVIFGRLFDHVGYGEIEGLFRALVLSRLVVPGSKLKTVGYLWRYNAIKCSTDKIYRYLEKLCNKDLNKASIKDRIKQITFSHSVKTMGGCIDGISCGVQTERPTIL